MHFLPFSLKFNGPERCSLQLNVKTFAWCDRRMPSFYTDNVPWLVPYTFNGTYR
ncbi:Protein of unknown function [Pyronema omphalodes CBS 100304]|uniref:Uncharacterized protein n=1 Tax=Pyronema omphalodes (strain CBS 100304) TaxID=1076935 RepID=U4KZV5_PYROM|nr:Protein of unknown function [Pyronema omphalodes CBS 100304]